jgi:chitodextrinase
VTNLTSSKSDTTATFYWIGVVGATGYRWSINGISYNYILGTSVLITGLTPNTAYTFHVYPIYNSGDGSSCVVTQNFTTTNVAGDCAAPANLVLDNETATSFRATWDAVAGASGYEYQVNGGGWVNTTSTTVVVNGLTPNTDYNFVLAAVFGGTACPTAVPASTTTAPADNCIIAHAQNQVPGGSVQIKGTAQFPVTSIVQADVMVTTNLRSYPGQLIFDIGTTTVTITITFTGGGGPSEVFQSLSLYSIAPMADVNYTYKNCGIV